MNRDFPQLAHRRTRAAVRAARFKAEVSLLCNEDDMTPEELAIVSKIEVRDISDTDEARRIVLTRFPEFRSLFTMEHVFAAVVEDVRKNNVSMYGYSAESFTRELLYFGNDLVIDDESFPDFVASMWNSRSNWFEYRCAFPENAEAMEWVENTYRMIALSEEEMRDARQAGDFEYDFDDFHPLY